MDPEKEQRRAGLHQVLDAAIDSAGPGESDVARFVELLIQAAAGYNQQVVRERDQARQALLKIEEIVTPESRETERLGGPLRTAVAYDAILEEARKGLGR